MPRKSQCANREVSTAKEFRQIVPSKKADENIAFTKIRVGNCHCDDESCGDVKGKLHKHLIKMQGQILQWLNGPGFR